MQTWLPAKIELMKNSEPDNLSILSGTFSNSMRNLTTLRCCADFFCASGSERMREIMAERRKKREDYWLIDKGALCSC